MKIKTIAIKIEFYEIENWGEENVKYISGRTDFISIFRSETLPQKPFQQHSEQVPERILRQHLH